MSAYYSSCRNCGNRRKGTMIYQCGHCGKIFCDNCSGSDTEYPGLLDRIFGEQAKTYRACPKCNSRSLKLLGRIR